MKYYPFGLERLSIFDLHCRLGLYRRSSRNCAKVEFKKRDEANSTEKQAIPKINQSIYMIRLRNELLLLRAKLTFRLVVFEDFVLLIFLKLRAWAIAISCLSWKKCLFLILLPRNSVWLPYYGMGT